ncbi:hypothetical protein ACTXJK_12920 [Brachybacterium tyrofermentans]|uniref:hypothetical protein n=1 Tax=Brachybacterium tyrofermentans TaxID=47848 RepID=UPI003FCF2B2E
MNATEFSDLDGDALTVTTAPDGVWITCTQGPHEVTVGPLPRNDLLGALGRSSTVTSARG